MASNSVPKKKINCSVKGKANEREIVNILNKRFLDILSKNPNWGLFSRSIGSGNRNFQVSLSNSAKQIFTSDLACPPTFKFTIESKAGYAVDLCSVFNGGHRILDEFILQATADGEKSSRMPLILWKKNHQPRLAFINSIHLDKQFEYSLKYKNWTIIAFNELLKEPDSFFFSS
jgi:hypothetical protein